MFVCRCIYKKRIGTKHINPVLLAISIKNIIAISTCVPLATVMLNVPAYIQILSCDIQENLTYITVFAGFLFPALLSIVQCDHIIRPYKLLLRGKRVIFVLCLVSAISVLLGIQAELSEDTHGCHLWSIRSDAVVMMSIYSLACVVLLTLVIMVTSYMIIYYHARARMAVVPVVALTTVDKIDGTSHILYTLFFISGES